MISVGLALTLPVLLASCTSKSDSAAGDIAVTADDSSCVVARESAETGTVTFRIANNGSKVSEFYVYGTGDRVIGEVENIGPGLTRQLIVAVPDPGTYQTACKPGMVGDGIRHDFTVTGPAQQRDESGKLAEAADGYKRYLVSQVTALQETAKTFVAAIEAGDIASAKKQYPLTRTYYERIEPVAESFPNDLDPRLDLREADLAAGDAWTGFHRLEKDLWARGPQPDTNRIADQLLADIEELVAGVSAADYSIDPVQVAGVRRHCSTRSRAPRSLEKRTPSPIPISGISRPMSTAPRRRSRVCAPYSMSATPTSAPRSTAVSPNSTANWRSTATGTRTSATRLSATRSAGCSRVASTPCPRW